MERVADFLEIPVRDDAREFSSIRRGFQTLDCLSTIDVRVAGKDIVDLGAGFGSLSIAAARSGAATVLAVDVHPVRLAEIRSRAEGYEARVETMTLNLLDGWPGEPAADVAFLLGVVEYAGLWSAAGTPADLQRSLLRTAYEALRPGGLLVLGTKNRAWPGFLAKDVHTGQPLVNAVPRRLADRLSERRFGAPYRHHLHTPRGWIKLLTAAGFDHADAYVPYMSYQFPITMARRPGLSDIAQVKRSAPTGPERDAALGRAPTIKAMLMAAGGVLHLPISHSTVIVAAK